MTATFKESPREFALALVADGTVTADRLLLCCLRSMSFADVQAVLEAEQLSPHFAESDVEIECCIDCGSLNIEEGTCLDCEAADMKKHCQDKCCQWRQNGTCGAECLA
jgi:hypothetical protein